MEEGILLQDRARVKPVPAHRAIGAGFRVMMLVLMVALALVAVASFGMYIITSQVTWAYSGTQVVPGTGGVFSDGESTSLELVAVGDVMLSRKVGRYMDEKGIGYPFALVNSLLRETDLSFANLESPIGSSGTPLPGKGIWFRARPEAVQALTGAGFDVVSVANNHALDYDTAAFLETLQLLEEAGIGYVGGGNDIRQARRPLVVVKNGIKVAFLAYSDMAEMFWSRTYPRMLRATDTTPGIAPLRLDEMLEDVAAVRPEVDVVIVSLHWGQEYMDNPTPAQREMAYRLVDAGVDLILGHHPHTLQGFEMYRNSLIAYSLGNFVFDQGQKQITQEGLLLQVKIGKLGVEQARVLPVYLPEAQPRVATGELGERILLKTQRLTGSLGGNMVIREGHGELQAKAISQATGQ